jgi:hypothetical protein
VWPRVGVEYLEPPGGYELLLGSVISLESPFRTMAIFRSGEEHVATIDEPERNSDGTIEHYQVLSVFRLPPVPAGLSVGGECRAADDPASLVDHIVFIDYSAPTNEMIPARSWRADPVSATFTEVDPGSVRCWGLVE